MSRTDKDKPYAVRQFQFHNRRMPGGVRGLSRWDLYEVVDELEYACLFWDVKGYSCSKVGKIAKGENRRYRSRERQAVRAGRYDEIPKPVRNARWQAF